MYYSTIWGREKKKQQEIGKGHKDVDSVEKFKCATRKCLAFQGDFGGGGKAAECVCMSPSKGEPRTARSASPPPQRFVLDADFLF